MSLQHHLVRQKDLLRHHFINGISAKKLNDFPISNFSQCLSGAWHMLCWLVPRHRERRTHQGCVPCLWSCLLEALLCDPSLQFSVFNLQQLIARATQSSKSLTTASNKWENRLKRVYSRPIFLLWTLRGNYSITEEYKQSIFPRIKVPGAWKGKKLFPKSPFSNIKGLQISASSNLHKISQFPIYFC